MDLATVWPLLFGTFLDIMQDSSWNVDPKKRNSIVFGCQSKKVRRQACKDEKYFVRFTCKMTPI